MTRTLIVGTIIAFTTFLILWFYSTLLVPLFLSMFFTYILLPAVDYLEEKAPIARAYIVIIVVVLVIGFLGLAVAGVVPAIREQVLAIASMIPKARDSVVESWLPWIREIAVDRFSVMNDLEYKDLIREFKLSSQLAEPATALQNIMNRTTGVVGGVVNVALIPVFSFFMLKDMAAIRRQIRKLIPADIMPTMEAFARDVDKTLRNVIKRQLTVALILGIFYMIGFSIVGLKFSLAIGAIAGLCRIVPYLDVIVGGLLAFVVIVTDPGSFSWGIPIGVAVVFILAQTIDGMFITPRVIGEKVGLHPGIVIASIFACGDWFGFAGVLIAIPLVAVLKIVIVACANAYQQSGFFNNSKV